MKNFYKITQIVFVTLLILSISLNVYYCTKPNDRIIETDSIITEKIDTIHDTVPQVKKETLIKYSTDTLLAINEEHDTIEVEAIIPITQKEYSDDSTYTAWVSGYKAELDSIHTYNKTITIEKFIEKKPSFWKRFAVGPQIGVGYDPINNKPSTYVGIGVTFNILKP